MGNFSWNLGRDNATASDSHQDPPTVQNSVAPAEMVPAQAVPAQAVPVQGAATSVVADAPLTRRELRHRAEARRAPASLTPEPSVRVEAHVAPVGRATAAGRKAAKRTSVSKQSTSPGSRPRSKFTRRRTLFSKLFSLGAMIGVGALMVSTSLPANAFYNSADATSASMKSMTSRTQSLKVASTAVETVSARDEYTVSSLAQQLRLKYGNQSFSYTNDINGTIQWPFPVAVPISSGYGPRISPCGGCSSFHQGVDFDPGRGAAIGAIADGVVTQVVATHSGWGNHVMVEHVINGQKVESLYGHMLDNSFEVTVGEAVKVGQTLGHVGSTGESTGAHLHLEIHLNGVPVDPFAWLKANAN